jgi:hypothetical protein
MQQLVSEGMVDSYFPAVAASIPTLQWVNLRDLGGFRCEPITGKETSNGQASGSQSQ